MRVIGKLLLILTVTLALTAAMPSLGADAPQSNFNVTRQIYDDLLENADRDRASLTLFIRMLPKGGDLHHHFSGSIYAETYLEWIDAAGYCVLEEVNAGDKTKRFFVSITPGTLTAQQRASCRSAGEITGNAELYRALLKSWSSQGFVTNDAATGDQHFFDAFQYFSNLASVSHKKGLAELKAQAKLDNVSYIETMLSSSPAVKSEALDALLPNGGESEAITDWDSRFESAFSILEGLAESEQKIDTYVQTVRTASAGVDDEDFTVRFIAYANRNNPPADVFSQLFTAYRADSVSDDIVGINIVGPENAPVAMRDYALHMKMFAFFNKKFPGINVSLHAGEFYPGMVPPEGMAFHIGDAVEIAGAKRIGHGVAIAYETGARQTLERMRDEEVAVEISLTSNEFILGIVAPDHPLNLYRTQGVPFVITTDDSGILRSTLSNEYLSYVLQFQPDYDELKQTVTRSIEHSFLPADVKEKVSEDLRKKLDTFEADIAQSFARPRN
jgi:adenosine deaminase